MGCGQIFQSTKLGHFQKGGIITMLRVLRFSVSSALRVSGLNPAPTHTNNAILGKLCLCPLFFLSVKVGIITILLHEIIARIEKVHACKELRTISD